MIGKLIESKKYSLPYKYLIVWEMSERKIGLTKEISSEVNWEQMTEYRCFDENGEIYGIKKGEKLLLREIIESEEDESITLEYPIVGNVRKLGNILKIKRYIDFDEDGQGTIIASRCVSIMK